MVRQFPRRVIEFPGREQQNAATSNISSNVASAAGKHDDICDALGLIGQLLDQMVAGRAPAKSVERQRDAYVEYTERVDIDLATL